MSERVISVDFHRFGVAFRLWQAMKRRDEMLFLTDFGARLLRGYFLRAS
jgi:hypothetical protein